jgi:mRNA interferase MazF
MRRGEIVSVNFDPAQGSEASKTRPAVVVSNDAANATATRLGRGVITVVPVTSNITRIYPFQVLLPAHLTGLPRDSKAQAEQIRSVSVDRVSGFLGQLSPSLVSELDRALRVQLSLLADVTAMLTATSPHNGRHQHTLGTVQPGKTPRDLRVGCT